MKNAILGAIVAALVILGVQSAFAAPKEVYLHEGQEIVIGCGQSSD